ncbi:MAG: putative Eukaryotic translation initiation factor 1A [Streblomastix strix]|uniref:Putative Eukaryotic translation initiation factor 1A n=1 Tax=Streblomastix strix TaxID=222440 RepID=A0A5J4WM21_9EUKA|nr:MAG: putative Eukaryotic translation initiation factor 1A [Streblomastix strix]
MISAIRTELAWNHHAQGSSFLQVGQTQVFCSIFGPKERSKSSRSQDAELFCSVQKLSGSYFSENNRGGEHTKVRDFQSVYERIQEQRHQEIHNDQQLAEKVLLAIRCAIRGEIYRKSQIEIAIVVVCDDGGILSSCINAASLALANAGIELLALITASYTAILPSALSLEPDQRVISHSKGEVNISILWNVDNWLDQEKQKKEMKDRQERTLFETDNDIITSFFVEGLLNEEEMDNAIVLCISACQEMGRRKINTHQSTKRKFIFKRKIICLNLARLIALFPKNNNTFETVTIIIMPKNKGKGGKNRKKGKNEGDNEKRDLQFKDECQEYAQVIRLLGNGRLEANCFDGKKRQCTIRGKLRKKIWIVQGDIILVSLRDFQDDKGDVIVKYTAEEARRLKQFNQLPENVQITETEAGNDDGDDVADFGEDEEDVDVDDI